MSRKEHNDLIKRLDEDNSSIFRLGRVDEGDLLTRELTELFNLNLELDMEDSDEDDEKVDRNGFDHGTLKSSSWHR